VPRLAKRPVADILLAGPKIWIYRLTDPEPRAMFISHAVVADTEAYVKAGQFSVNPAAETAIIDNDTAPSRSYPRTSGESGHAQIVAWDRDRVEVEVESALPGILVLREPYYPGWFVEVDGQPARLLRANVLFRGVEVSEGSHRVVFSYAPFSFANLRDAAAALLRGPRRRG
jgi:hypothetical protein